MGQQAAALGRTPGSAVTLDSCLGDLRARDPCTFRSEPPGVHWRDEHSPAPTPQSSCRRGARGPRTHATQVGRDGRPHPDAAPAQALANGELNVEQRDALEGQGNDVGDEEGTCRDAAISGPCPLPGPALAKVTQGAGGDEEKHSWPPRETALASGMCLLKPWSPTLRGCVAPTLWDCVGFPLTCGLRCFLTGALTPLFPRLLGRGAGLLTVRPCRRWSPEVPQAAPWVRAGSPSRPFTPAQMLGCSQQDGPGCRAPRTELPLGKNPRAGRQTQRLPSAPRGWRGSRQVGGSRASLSPQACWGDTGPRRMLPQCWEGDWVPRGGIGPVCALGVSAAHPLSRPWKPACPGPARAAASALPGCPQLLPARVQGTPGSSTDHQAPPSSTGCCGHGSPHHPREAWVQLPGAAPRNQGPALFTSTAS